MRRITLLIGAALLFAASPARATGFTDIGEDIVPRTDVAVKLDGYLRARAEDLYNLDLDRGTTPSGQPLFPVPLGNPNSQAMSYADIRLRSDVSVYASTSSTTWPPGATRRERRLHRRRSSRLRGRSA